MLPLLLGAILVVFAGHLPAVSGRFVVAGLTGLILLQSGADWPEAGRRRLLTRFAEGHAIELYQEGVTVVTGDYWRVWPYAFALNLLHERVSGNRPCLPVALRSEDLYLRRAMHHAGNKDRDRSSRRLPLLDGSRAQGGTVGRAHHR